MNDPWGKAYVYGRAWWFSKTAHIVRPAWGNVALCQTAILHTNHTPKPYPVCKSCLKTKRAKELGLA